MLWLSEKVDLKKIEIVWNEYISKAIGNFDYKDLNTLSAFEKKILQLIVDDLQSKLELEDES